MLVNVYVIKDVKSGFDAPLTSYGNELVAKRECASLFKSGKQNRITEFPEDFELWQVACFDTETGVITPKLEHIVNLVDFVNGKE